MTYIDLSHEIHDGLPATPPDLGTAHVEAIIDHDASRERYKGKAEFHIGRTEMPGNVATYLDSPWHRWREREDLSQIDLRHVAGLPGIVVRARGAEAVTIDLPPADVRGRAVLVESGRSEAWGTPSYLEDPPYLSTAAIDLLIEGEAALVAVDWANVDDTTDPARPAHSRLLEAGVLIVENATNLGALPDEGFRFTAVPPMIVRGASFPVRAFAELDA